jgi:hypothetical protein
MLVIKINFKNEGVEMEDVIFVKITKLYRDDMSDEELYEATRGVWKVNTDRIKNIKYVFALYKGIIKEVYTVKEWTQPTGNYKSRKIDVNEAIQAGKSEFIGEISDIREDFINKDVSSYYKRGEANPIKYMSLSELQKDLL